MRIRVKGEHFSSKDIRPIIKVVDKIAQERGSIETPKFN